MLLSNRCFGTLYVTWHAECPVRGSSVRIDNGEVIAEFGPLLVIFTPVGWAHRTGARRSTKASRVTAGFLLAAAVAFNGCYASVVRMIHGDIEHDFHRIERLLDRTDPGNRRGPASTTWGTDYVA